MVPRMVTVIYRRGITGVLGGVLPRQELYRKPDTVLLSASSTAFVEATQATALVSAVGENPA